MFFGLIEVAHRQKAALLRSNVRARLDVY